MSTVVEVTEKACIKCGVVKPLGDFYRRGDRYRADCKRCVGDRQAAYYRANADKVREYVKEWRQANPDKCREYHREFAQRNAESERERQRVKSRNTLREVALERERRYQQKYPEKVRGKQHRRRARRRENGEFLILDREYRRLYASPCAVCETTENITADHIIPIARGGRHSIGNLQPLCLRCNCRKKERLMVEFKKYDADLDAFVSPVVAEA